MKSKTEKLKNRTNHKSLVVRVLIVIALETFTDEKN